MWWPVLIPAGLKADVSARLRPSVNRSGLAPLAQSAPRFTTAAFYQDPAVIGGFALPVYPVAGAIPMKALVFALALAATSAGAMEMVSRGSGVNRMRLMQTPCTNAAVLDQIVEDKRAEFRSAEATISRGTFAGCWVATDDGSVFLVFEDGSSFAMPQAAFKREPGV